jgi:hypothetical protein
LWSARSPQRADFGQRAGERLRHFVDLWLDTCGLVRVRLVDGGPCDDCYRLDLVAWSEADRCSEARLVMA